MKLQAIADFLIKNYKLSLAVLFLILVAGLTINLGLMPFDSDEPTRVMVAIEMLLSGNYWVPTINGEFYYNKPPLFNWYIILSWKLWGVMNEFSSRFPTIISTFGYTISIYWISKKFFPKKYALLNALMFLTCGRIIFYDTFLALIDITFSWVLYLMFMVIFIFYQKKAWYKLFISAYVLCAIAFLMKGLPSIVFIGTALVVIFGLDKNIKGFFSLPHVLGGLLFLAIVGGYYGIYNQYNDLETVFTTLFTETSKRTVVRFGIWTTLLHLLSFPFEMVYHFLPWSLFIFTVWSKKIRSALWDNPYIKYCIVTFVLAVIPYWTSPEVFPRYLHMLSPLIFSVFTYAIFIAERDNEKWINGFKVGFKYLALIATVGLVVVPYIELFQVDYLYLKVLIVMLFSAATVVVLFKSQEYNLIAFAATLIVLRLGFSWFILPSRHKTADIVQLKEHDIEIGKKYVGKPLKMSSIGGVGHFTSFYITRERKDYLPVLKKSEINQNAFIIVPMSSNVLSNDNLIVHDTITIVWEHKKKLIVSHRE